MTGPESGGETHWNGVYGARPEAALTWFEEEPTLSLTLLAEYAPPGAAVLDVGGGASRLAERLLARGLGRITVLDLSEAALAVSRARMGEVKAAQIAWVVGDVTQWAHPPLVDVWHDRAAFHFLTDEAGQAAYLDTLAHALRPGGYAIIASFADDGPEKCSNLPVQRYAPEGLTARLEGLRPGLLSPVAATRHVHVTPKGNRQAFQTSVFRRL